jgi:hypothetical protein
MMELALEDIRSNVTPSDAHKIKEDLFKIAVSPKSANVPLSHRTIAFQVITSTGNNLLYIKKAHPSKSHPSKSRTLLKMKRV